MCGGCVEVRSWVGRPRPSALERTGDRSFVEEGGPGARPRFVQEVSRASQSCRRRREKERWATIHAEVGRVARGVVHVRHFGCVP